MKKRIFSLVLALSCMAVLSACGEEETAETEESSTAVEIATVERGSISSESNVSGQVVSDGQESVSVALSVRCTDVYVEVGDTVSAGQAICKLDISATMANYETASMSYDNAKKSYAEQSSLLSQQVAQAEKNVSDTQALFDSGTILSLSAVENGFVSPSAPVATIDSTTDMEVKVGVSESLIGKLQVGGRVSVSIDAADKEFQGTISALEKSADATTHLYGVTIQVPSAYSRGLLSGMFADVTFYTDTQSDVVIVPTEAIQTGMDGQYVYTIDSDNIAHRIPVETGLVGDGETEITSGLSGGETLVTVGQFYLSEGAAVRVVAPEVAS